MKKLMMICALVLSVITYANAQQGGGGRGFGRRMMLTPEQSVSKMDSVVKLSADQKTKMLAIYTDAAASRKKLMDDQQANGGGDRDAAMQKFQEMNKATTEKTNGVLTADQQTAWATYQKAAREQMMKQRQAQGGGNN